MYFDDPASEDVFSVFEFRYRCEEEGGYCTYKTMIEPLAFLLRHPVALCYQSFPDKSLLLPNKIDSLMDQGYLFYATNEQTDFGPRQHTHVDLGALVRGAVRFSFRQAFYCIFIVLRHAHSPQREPLVKLALKL